MSRVTKSWHIRSRGHPLGDPERPLGDTGWPLGDPGTVPPLSQLLQEPRGQTGHGTANQLKICQGSKHPRGARTAARGSPWVTHSDQVTPRGQPGRGGGSGGVGGPLGSPGLCPPRALSNAWHAPSCPDPGTFPFYGAELSRGPPDPPNPNPAGSTWIAALPQPSPSAPGDTWGLGSTSGCHQLGAHTLCGFCPLPPTPQRDPRGTGTGVRRSEIPVLQTPGVGEEGLEGKICSFPSAGGSEMLPQQQRHNIHLRGLGTLPFPRERGHLHPRVLLATIPGKLPELWGGSGWLFTRTHMFTHVPCPRTRPRRCL